MAPLHFLEKKSGEYQEALIGCAFVLAASMGLLIVANSPHGGEEIKNILEQGRSQARTAVNFAMVEAYWLIGQRIVSEEQKGEERAAYGKQILKQLASALSSEFGKGFTREQIQESITQRVVTSDISELLTKTNTKKVELKKTENIVKSNFVEKAIKNIKMTKSGGANVARIMLNPRSLGDITLRITMIGNNVKLYIKADKSEAAEHIDRQLPLLKERMAESGLKVEQVVIESSETDHLANNQERQNRNEKEELRREFVKSFGRIAAKGEFDISMNDVAYYNNNPFVGYTKAGSKVNV